MCDVTNWIYMVCDLRCNGGFSGYQVALVRSILIFERCHKFGWLFHSPRHRASVVTTETGV